MTREKSKVESIDKDITKDTFITITKDNSKDEPKVTSEDKTKDDFEDEDEAKGYCSIFNIKYNDKDKYYESI